jgi:HTH-type transcriptional regulator/antitoxin HigA
MDIRPIKNEDDYRRALAEIDRLLNAEPGSPDEDRLEVISTLVASYEDQHYPILPPDPIEAMLYFMESRGLSRRDLESSIGSRARVSEVLSRKRPLTIDMIRRLHKELGISADILIEQYPIRVGKDVGTVIAG